MKQSSRVQLQRLNLVILGGFFLLTLSLLFWSVIRAPAILAREDNPRLVEADLDIQRGDILDKNGRILAESVLIDGNVARIYPVPNSGPAVGYYSFRHGTAGVEESFADILRGENDNTAEMYWRNLLHQPQVGHDIQLTIDARWQQVASAILEDKKGAILLLTMPADKAVPIAEIIAMVSHPDYDANRLDAQFEALVADENAPLLNRTTQGQYQPGMLLQPFVMAAAVELGVINLNDLVQAGNEPVQINGHSEQCYSHLTQPANWRDVLLAKCPAPMIHLGNSLGLGGLDQAFAAFSLTQTPDLPINAEIGEPERLTDPLLAAIGQDTLTLTPVQAAVAWIALMTNGRLPTLQLVTSVQDASGEWHTQIPEILERETAVSAITANDFREILRNESSGISEHNILVLAGPEDSTNGWYLGALTHENAHYFVVVVVEESKELSESESVGRQLLTAVKNQ
jgi:peptidoglycan glycosyltransferase